MPTPLDPYSARRYAAGDNPAGHRIPIATTQPQNTEQTDDATRMTEWQKARDLLTEREGNRNDVYLDSLGKPTVGIGHYVQPEDHLKVGDIITDE